MSFSNLKLAYITSMATGGLAGFNYRELKEMKKMGSEINLFVTKYVLGPYMAPQGVRTFPAKPIETLISQPSLFIKNPVFYVKLFIEATMTNTVIDFLIAQRWSNIMIKNESNWIHCHWGDHKLYIAYYCHKITDIPLSVTLHGYDLYANPNWKMFERSLNVCSEIITISEYNKRLLINKYGGALGERVKVIRLSADAPVEQELMQSTKYVLIVGGYQDRKGYDILMKAFSILRRKDVHLWVVGYKGPVDVEKLVKKFRIQEQVTLFGQVSDNVLRFLYVFCDIFCMPSRTDKDGIGEGLPVALMEAMSFGKPIVSTYHTGIPELVPDILVPENDAQALAEAIGKYADDEDLRKRDGTRNREIVKNDYSNLNVKKLLDALKIDIQSAAE